MPQLRVCRLCLYKGDENQILSIWENQVVDLADKIFDCVSINVTKDDVLPTSACLSCIHQITQWDIFRTTCQKSNEILSKSVETNHLNVEFENFLIINDGNDRKKETSSLRSNKKLRKRKLSSSDDEQDEEEQKEEEQDELFESDFLNYKFKSADFCGNVYQCEICSAEFDTCFTYLDHQEVHNGEEVFQCDKCPQLFKMRQDLVEHDRNHKKPCETCGKLILKSSMKLHLIKHTDKYKCDRCNVHCNSNAALEQHKITVHTSIKDHICETCGKCFSSKTAIKVHRRSHSDERLYPCKLCNYAGRTASAIYVHMSTHANDLCVCEICSKLFKSTRNLNDHLRRVHSTEKKHHCTYCNKRFVDKYMLHVHLRCHTGIRPYKCTVCDKAFIRSDGLREHMSTHGQRTFHECKNCAKKFASKRGVARHTCSAIL